MPGWNEAAQGEGVASEPPFRQAEGAPPTAIEAQGVAEGSERPGWDLAPTPGLSSTAEWPWKAAAEAAADTGAAAAPRGAAEVLSFERDLRFDRFEVLWRQRVEPSQRRLEQVTEVLRRRAALERRYGESLIAFSGEVELERQANSVQGAVDAVMVNFRNRGEQSIELAEQLEQDIVCSLEAVIRQHREVSQQMLRDFQLLARYCQEKQHAHDKLARRYSARCVEAEAAGQECLQGLAVKTAERLKLAQRATVLSKQARSAEHEYYAAIDQANRAQALHDQHLPLLLAALQDLEEKRGKCLKDGLMKLAVYETSWLRNLQYDLEATVKAVEGADVCKDLQEFIKQHQDEQMQKGMQLIPQAFWMLGKLKEAPKTIPAAKQQPDAQALMRQLLAEELRPPLHGLLGEGAALGAADELKERLEQLRLSVGDARCRAGLCQVLREEVLAREPPGTDIDNAKGLAIPLATLEALIPLVKAALDACDEQNDTWCGRDLMVIVNLVTSEGDGGKKVSVLSRVYNHALWNKVTFWEEVLLIGLCEAHCAEAVWRRSQPPGSQFIQPAMTAFLQRFLAYMMAFGISFEQGRPGRGRRKDIGMHAEHDMREENFLA